MNFLAHAYLSFEQDSVLTGNMISDFVKGKKKELYAPEIKKGIMLHRFIDGFTDTHPVVKEIKKIFDPLVGLYAGAFIDVSFDYFLANDATLKSLDQWIAFSTYVYTVLDNNFSILPQRFQAFFPFMKKDDWLFNYRYEWGIENSFQAVVRRAKYLHSAEGILWLFQNHLAELENAYRLFFPELIEAVKKEIIYKQ